MSYSKLCFKNISIQGVPFSQQQQILVFLSAISVKKNQFSKIFVKYSTDK